MQSAAEESTRVKQAMIDQSLITATISGCVTRHKRMDRLTRSVLHHKRPCVRFTQAKNNSASVSCHTQIHLVSTVQHLKETTKVSVNHVLRLEDKK